MPVTWPDEKLILLYCPGRGSNTRPSARRGVNMMKVSHALNHSATAADRVPQKEKERERGREDAVFYEKGG